MNRQIVLLVCLVVNAVSCKDLNTCTQRNSAMLSRGVTKEDKILIVQLHNAVRNELAAGRIQAQDGLLPQAADMNKLVWNEDLAAAAQVQADTCITNHWNPPAGRFGYDYGQNIFYFKTTGSKVPNSKWDGVIKGWSGRIKNFPISKIEPFVADYNYGHGTQLFWAETRMVGCGMSSFPTGDPKFKTMGMFTCNYHPEGNVISTRLYQVGKACSKCDACSTKYHNLCRPKE